MNVNALLVVLFLVTYGGLGCIALRRPLLARLAAREALRRPWQSTLVVAGLVTGAAMVLCAQVHIDSVNNSLATMAYRSWGRVDIVVTHGGQPFSPGVASELAADAQLRGSTSGVQGGVELIGSVGDLDRGLGKSDVRLVGFDPSDQRAFGAFRLTDGRLTYGQDLAASEVLVSKSLANLLEARPGDRIRISVRGGAAPAEYTVRGVARSQGPGAYGLRPAVFVPTGSMRMLTGSDQINVVRISATGEGHREIERAARLAPKVAAVVRGRTGDAGWQVRQAKADDVNELLRLANDNRPLTLGLSLLVVLAGLALVVSLALALGEERRPRLAVLRAMGLGRRGLMTAALLEGSLYSIAAALAGVPLGVLAGWFLVSHWRAVIPEINERDAALQLAVTPEAVAGSIAAGALVTLAALLAVSLRTTRMSVSSSLRELPEPASSAHSGPMRLAGTILLAALGIAALVGGPVPRLLGGLALIVLVGLIITRRLPDRLRATAVGAGVAAWALADFSTLSYGEVTANIWIVSLVVAAGVAGLSVVVAVNLRVVELPATRPLLAHLTRRPMKATLNTGALGLVAAALTVLAVYLSFSNPDYARASGGYDVRAVSASSMALPSWIAAMVEREVAIPTLSYLGPFRSSTSIGGPSTTWHEDLIPLYEFSDQLLQNPPVPITERDPRFPSDAAVWEALRRDPTLVLSTPFNAGSSMTLIGTSGPVEFRVAASFPPGVFSGVIGSSRALAPLASAPRGTTLLLKARPGISPQTLALDIRRSQFAAGVDAVTSRELLDAGIAPFRIFIHRMQLLSSMGLVVGVVSVGVNALRAVIERRRTIGLMRALGLKQRQVLLSVVAEAALITTAGLVVGVSVGLLAGHLVLRPVFRDVQASVDGGSMVIMVGLVYAAVLLATIGPAVRASQLPPAEALRVVG